ncbi:MAG: metal-dependent hydrolase, partial [Balneolaceae bacterium]|nr:metal-dependent hydrolase [Balneolaceae bacterium]
GMLDACTSYGVKLLWPFVDERYALNIISVFDPVFSIVLLGTTALVFFKRQQLLSWLPWSWVVLYLLWGSGQYERAKNIASQIAARQNHIPVETVIKPTIANELLWSVRYVSQNDILYAYGVRISPFADPVIYRGNSVPMLDWRSEYADYRGTVLYNDIQRFAKLSEGYLVRHPMHSNVIGDGRYAMLPTSVSPLWGIKIDTTKPENHVEFETFRDAGPEVRNKFLDMLLGR